MLKISIAIKLNFLINKMGCDYYIIKELEIYFQYSIYSPIRIELKRTNGYFNFNIDSDDPQYEELEKEYINNKLTPNMKPIIIYEKNQFINGNDHIFIEKKYEIKYKDMIDDRLKVYNKTNENKKEWKDIQKISKVERRYERN